MRNLEQFSSHDAELLIQKCCSKDQTSWEILYRILAPIIAAYNYHDVPSGDDLIQSVMEKVYIGLPKFDGMKINRQFTRNFLAWVKTIILNERAKILKGNFLNDDFDDFVLNKNNFIKFDLFDEDEVTDNDDSPEQTRDKLYKHLEDSVPYKWRKIVRLKLRGLTPCEIAKMLNVSEGHVVRLLARIRKFVETEILAKAGYFPGSKFSEIIRARANAGVINGVFIMGRWYVTNYDVKIYERTRQNTLSDKENLRGLLPVNEALNSCERQTVKNNMSFYKQYIFCKGNRLYITPDNLRKLREILNQRRMRITLVV